VIEAEDRDGKVEQPANASPRLGGIVHVLLPDDPQPPLRQMAEEVRDEGDASFPVDHERVLRRPGARREDGVEAARQLVAVGVAHVRLLLDLP
jgi:hypothetical protein